MPKEVQDFSKYVFWAIIISLIFLSYLIIKPHIIAIISAIILAYLAKPLHKILCPKIGNSLSAFISILTITLIIILPLGAIIGGIINQANELLNLSTFNIIFEKISSYSLMQKLNINLATLTEKVLTLTISFLSSSVSALPSIVLSLFIAIFGSYYILLNWDYLTLKMEKYLPFENKKRIREEISKITDTLIYGTILIALIEFTIAFNGFLISGVGPYLILPILIFFLAFIPGLGPTLVWLPLAIYYAFTSNYPTAIGVTITGLILNIPIDTILRAKLLGNKIKLNPLIMLIGILGGISLFGIFGFIIGPLILIYTIKLIEETLMKN